MSRVSADDKRLTGYVQVQEDPAVLVFDLVGPPAVTLGLARGRLDQGGIAFQTPIGRRVLERVRASTATDGQLFLLEARRAKRVRPVLLQALKRARTGDAFLLLSPSDDQQAAAMRKLDLRPELERA